MRTRNVLLIALFLVLPILLISPVKGEDMGLVRLHVIANSDSDYDQYVKLKVRDSVLKVSAEIPPEQIENSLPLLEDAARVTLASYGCNPSARVEFGRFDFPTKTYGNVTLPAGEYTAVRVIIGDGIGHNWWCVMYPPLCFTNETTAHFKDDSIYTLTQNGKPKFKVKLKILELFD
ncbi:MAG: stage II sporulation protein R [Monoglobales bacterium]